MDQEKMIQETHDTVIKLNTVLLGSNGRSGLVDEVKAIAVSHYSLKRNFWTLIGVLVGSGIIGSGIYTLLNGG